MFGKSKKNKSLSAWKTEEAMVRNVDRMSWISYNCRRLHVTHIFSKVHDTITFADNAEDMVVSAYSRIRAHELKEITKKRADGKKITRQDRIALMAARWYLAWARDRVEDAKKVVDTE